MTRKYLIVAVVAALLSVAFITQIDLSTQVRGLLPLASVPNLPASQITSGQLALARGGTNADLSATGGASQVVRQSSAGAAFTVAQLAFTDLSGSASVAQIPNLPASIITSGQLALARGGTNADLSGTGGASFVLKQTSVGAAVTAAQLAFTDISGSVAASQLPNPTASTLGGIESYAAVSNQWINAISTSGVPSSTQPAFTNISGIATWPQMPLSNATGGIAFGNAVAGAKVTAGTLSTVLTPLVINRGDTVVVMINDSTAVEVYRITDNGGNPYSFLLTSIFATNTGITSVYVCINARNAATGFNVLSSSSHAFSFTAATYTGVKSTFGATPVAVTQLATNAGSISLTPTVANSFMVAGFGYFANTADVSANVGNLRSHQASTATIRGIAIVDNTQAGLGAETCSVTGTSTPVWANVAIELVPN